MMKASNYKLVTGILADLKKVEDDLAKLGAGPRKVALAFDSDGYYRTIDVYDPEKAEFLRRELYAAHNARRTKLIEQLYLLGVEVDWSPPSFQPKPADESKAITERREDG